MASHASGAALVTYDFENYTASVDTGSPASTVTPPVFGLSVTNLAPNAGTATPATGFLGRGGSGNAGNYFFTSATAPATPSNGAGRSAGTQSQYTYDTIANAVAGAAYYSFTVTPNGSGMLSFASTDTLTFALQVRSNNATGTVPYTVQFYLRSSADNFAADLGSSTALTINTASSSLSANESISLSGIGSLTAGQAVTFRLYPVDNQQAAGNDDFKFDNVVVNGTINNPVAAPEPSTYALLGLGLLGLVIFRRRAVF